MVYKYLPTYNNINKIINVKFIVILISYFSKNIELSFTNNEQLFLFYN